MVLRCVVTELILFDIGRRHRFPTPSGHHPFEPPIYGEQFSKPSTMQPVLLLRAFWLQRVAALAAPLQERYDLGSANSAGVSPAWRVPQIRARRLVTCG